MVLNLKLAKHATKCTRNGYGKERRKKKKREKRGKRKKKNVGSEAFRDEKGRRSLPLLAHQMGRLLQLVMHMIVTFVQTSCLSFREKCVL